MPRLHPAATKLAADEHGRTSCPLPNSWRRRQGGEGEGEQGREPKHGHYMQIQHLPLLQCFPSQRPVYFPTAKEPVVILHISVCKGLGGETGSWCRPVPAVRGVSVPLPARGCVPAGPAAHALPGNPGVCPRLGAVSGTENKAGAKRRPEQTSSSEYLPFYLFFSPRQLPMGTSQAERPVGAREEVSSSFTWWSWCLRGC